MTNTQFQSYWINNWIAIFAFSIAFSACDATKHESRNLYFIRAPEAVELDLKFVLSFGVDFDDSLSNSKPLSRISQIQLSDNKLFVLDRGFKEVIVFDNDSGNWSGLSFGSYGRGPGEFILPLAMDISDNKIFVYDYELRNVNIFNSSGELIMTNYLPISTKDIIVKGDTLFASLMSSRFHHASSFLIQREGEEMLKLYDHIPLTATDSLFNPDGLVNWIDKHESGDVVIGSERPGVFYVQNSNEDFSEKGSYLMNSIEGLTEMGIYNTRASTIGIEVANGRVYSVIQNHHSIKINPTPIEGYYLEIFSLSGEHLDYAKLPHSWISTFTVDPTGDYLYLAITDPFPQIMKYRILGLPND